MRVLFDEKSPSQKGRSKMPRCFLAVPVLVAADNRRLQFAHHWMVVSTSPNSAMPLHVAAMMGSAVRSAMMCVCVVCRRIAHRISALECRSVMPSYGRRRKCGSDVVSDGQLPVEADPIIICSPIIFVSCSRCCHLFRSVLVCNVLQCARLKFTRWISLIVDCLCRRR